MNLGNGEVTGFIFKRKVNRLGSLLTKQNKKKTLHLKRYLYPVIIL